MVCGDEMELRGWWESVKRESSIGKANELVLMDLRCYGVKGHRCCGGMGQECEGRRG